MNAYYNEIDPNAAKWLRELIKQGHIAPGVVDERSITEITPIELAGFTQCHFFAGIGVWSYALRQSGWADDRPVWTGSCPCQPFSSAGKGAGFADERHLWPSFHWLIQQCQPNVVFGEQVAGKAGETWLDLVQSDLENTGYTCGAAVTAACGFGAPNLRKRLYWVAESMANTTSKGLEIGTGKASTRPEPQQRPKRLLSISHLADTTSKGHPGSSWQSCSGAEGQPDRSTTDCGEDSSVANADSERCDRQRVLLREKQGNMPEVTRSGEDGRPGPTNGFWRDVDWIGCTDGKWRPVEPGLEPLANGAPARVGRLRGYGNAINAEQAKAFIESYIQTRIT